MIHFNKIHKNLQSGYSKCIDQQGGIKMKKVIKWMSPFLIILLLMGCGAKKEDAGNNNESSDVVPDSANEPADKENDRDIGEINDEVEDNVAEENGKIEIAEDAANKILEIGGVKSATVIVTDNNAYAAVNLGDDTAEDNSGEIEEKVSEKVKEADSNIENVYVSTDPDFTNRMRDYADKVDAGEPVEGFFEEFTEAMRDMFPDAK